MQFFEFLPEKAQKLIERKEISGKDLAPPIKIGLTRKYITVGKIYIHDLRMKEDELLMCGCETISANPEESLVVLDNWYYH
jgi:hypothetical protein